MTRDWLIPFLETCVRGFDDPSAHDRLENFKRAHPEMSFNEFIRRYLEYRLRDRGIVYGTPLTSEETITEHTEHGYYQRRAVFMSLLQVQAELAMEAGCAVNHCSRGQVRVVELLICFALFCRRMDWAGRLHGMLDGVRNELPPPAKMKKLGRKIESALREQAYMAGNPLLGLPIHNSFNYGDAKTLGRLAIAYFEHDRPERAAIQRVWDFHDSERLLLLQALVGLTQADRKIGIGSRRVMIRQIKKAGLSRRARNSLLSMLQKPIPPVAVAAAVSDDRTRDFLLEQVLLGAMLDGRVSEEEWAFIADLASWLGVEPGELARREAEVVAFYEKHKAFLDIFTVGSAVRSYRQRMLGRLQRALQENLDLIVTEIKNTGNLAEQLYRASTGEKLKPDEWREVRAQLLDIVRSVPSLAIFSLPGGVVLLPLVYKILPPGLKPRSFAEHDRKRQARKNTDPELSIDD